MFSNTWFLIIINIIISIIIIYGAHQFWNYLKDTYSKKKTKDLVGTQIEKYKRMVGEIQQGSQNEVISKEELKTMEEELLSAMGVLQH